ncbi:MAG: 2-C-methyl-D-erythritol 2,4-cyclodiphosphate synthase [candidate division Zixibacteria bacterium]|nr:2-C-methyl-D-erythritol 2,4-cyclodiphosphate synthase [candidate division Zixibacteria bacterium]
MSVPFRIGLGFDIHPFDKTRPLVLGGVKIRDRGGLAGHSDADAVMHAITDALLGATGGPDIGEIFPDTDDTYKDADSGGLLKKVWEDVAKQGWEIGNIDVVVIAESPKLAPFKKQMSEGIAKTLNIDASQVNIKATTSEGMGFIGRGEGIGVIANALLVAVGEKRA